EADIRLVKSLIAGRTLLCKANTCLDPTLYDISATGAKYSMFSGSLNELAPAVILGEAEMTLLDVPDTLVALQKWPGQIKVIGPVGEVQQMAVAFRKQSPGLRKEFNRFLRDCHADGTYLRLVRQYYPMVESFYPDFFRSLSSSSPSLGSSGASSPVGTTAAVGPAPAPRSPSEP
ncbi:MAG: type 2 periplasmic-binding domain-containing protein, partial [Limisphaerales bacterium]